MTCSMYSSTYSGRMRRFAPTFTERSSRVTMSIFVLDNPKPSISATSAAVYHLREYGMGSMACPFIVCHVVGTSGAGHHVSVDDRHSPDKTDDGSGANGAGGALAPIGTRRRRRPDSKIWDARGLPVADPCDREWERLAECLV